VAKPISFFFLVNFSPLKMGFWLLGLRHLREKCFFPKFCRPEKTIVRFYEMKWNWRRKVYLESGCIEIDINKIEIN
jgi:hypothetical protein